MLLTSCSNCRSTRLHMRLINMSRLSVVARPGGRVAPSVGIHISIRPEKLENEC